MDFFKSLTMQALQLQQRSLTENTMSLQCARFRRATTEQDWLHLLESTLLRVSSHVYLDIDLTTVDNTI